MAFKQIEQSCAWDAAVEAAEVMFRKRLCVAILEEVEVELDQCYALYRREGSTTSKGILKRIPKTRA